MAEEKILGITQELLDRCVRCGSCRQVCPVFNVTKEEPSVARGKIFLANLINQGKAELDREAAHFFNLCTTCLRCAEICPVMVDYEKIALSARAKAVEKFGLSPEKKIAVKLFSNPKLLNAVTRVSAPLSRLFTKKAKSPQNRLLPVELPKLGKVLLPQPALKPFNDKDKWFKAKRERGKLLFFTGCMFNNFYTETALNVIKVLNRLGYTVFVPKEQSCCGAPALFAGDLKTFEEMKEKNLKALKAEEFDFIVTACATCGHVLKREYKELPKPVKELLELLFENAEEVGKWKLPRPIKATWHHPCHIVRGQKIPKRYAEDLLRIVPNLEFVPMEESDNCCGMGGSFKLSYPQISREIQLKKARNSAATGAEVVLTECPGCVMNVAEGLERIGAEQKALHLADLLAQAETPTES